MALLIGVFIVFSALIAYPDAVKASWWSDFLGMPADASNAVETLTHNSQNIDLLEAPRNINSILAKADQTPVIVDNSSLLPGTDPAGNATGTVEVFDSSQITTYVVRSGDTLAQIAKIFGITENTIKIANDLASQKLIEGQHLIILPVSGVQHTVKSGQNLESIAKLYKLRTQDILQYNHLENPSRLAVGDQVFIPSDVLPAKTVAAPSSSTRTTPVLGAPLLNGIASSVKSLISTVGYFIEPLALGSYHKTQKVHGHNGVDLGAPVGTPIKAAADGEVVISRMGWNGGYGNYVVIQHDNGTQTVYGHASKLLVAEGETVTQGEKIALVGSTGESTGPHLHVEVRGGTNPF